MSFEKLKTIFSGKMILEKLKTTFLGKMKICSGNISGDKITCKNYSGILNQGSGQLTVNNNYCKLEDEKVILNETEKKILTLLAEGGRGVPALNEEGIIEQVNIYPNDGGIPATADETLKSFRNLLRNGLIAQDFATGKQEYAITPKGLRDLT